MDALLKLDDYKYGSVDIDWKKLRDQYILGNFVFSNGRVYSVLKKTLNNSTILFDLLVIDLRKSKTYILNASNGSRKFFGLGLEISRFLLFNDSKDDKKVGRVMTSFRHEEDFDLFSSDDTFDWSLFDVSLNFKANEYHLECLIRKRVPVLHSPVLNNPNYVCSTKKIDYFVFEFVIHEIRAGKNGYELRKLCSFTEELNHTFEIFGNYLIELDANCIKFTLRTLHSAEKIFEIAPSFATFLGGVSPILDKNGGGDKLVFINEYRTAFWLFELNTKQNYYMSIPKCFNLFSSLAAFSDQNLVFLSLDDNSAYSWPLNKPHKLSVLAKLSIRKRKEKREYYAGLRQMIDKAQSVSLKDQKKTNKKKQVEK